MRGGTSEGSSWLSRLDLYSPANPNALAQARGDLGVITTRANTGGAHAVQWSLPG
jgi:hypothetical protein